MVRWIQWWSLKYWSMMISKYLECCKMPLWIAEGKSFRSSCHGNVAQENREVVRSVAISHEGRHLTADIAEPFQRGLVLVCWILAVSMPTPNLKFQNEVERCVMGFVKMETNLSLRWLIVYFRWCVVWRIVRPGLLAGKPLRTSRPCADETQREVPQISKEKQTFESKTSTFLKNKRCYMEKK